MKKLIILIAMACTVYQSKAAVFTVCNLSNSGAQFTQIDPAIAAATNGDTIYVSGSSVGYADCTINKNIKLIGPGTYAQKDNQLTATIAIIGTSSGLNGIAVLGFRILNNIRIASNIQNLEIAFNLFAGNTATYFLGGTVNVSNIHVHSNIFNNGGNVLVFDNIASISNVTIEHNIIRGTITQVAGANFNIAHNIFYNSNGDAFGSVNNAVINDNIFYNVNPINGAINCAYNNNLSYSTSTTFPNMPIGNGNIDNTNPLLINVAATGGYLPTYNFNLQAGSPAINAASDGTNIGLFGGGNIVSTTGEVYNMPVIRKMLIQNTNVPQNGNVNVKVRSTKSRTN